MILYKLLICFIIFSSIFNFNFNTFADDLDLERIDDINQIIDVSSDISEEPNLNSRAAIIYDRCSGSILFGKNENEQRKMASTTKIMTAIVVIENGNLDDIVTVSDKAAGTGGSRLGLHANDKISVRNLLYGLLLCSGNDAAVALAQHIGNDLSGFADLMNKKCSELGLTSTHFVTPHGLDNDDHYTTAFELAVITDYALKNDVFKSIVGTKNYTVQINNHSKNLSNTNELLGNLDGVYGVKTGFTNGANRCLVTSIKRGSMDIICIVLGADTKKLRTADSVKLINYVFDNFEMINFREKIETEFNNWLSCNSSNFTVEKGISNDISPILDTIPYDYFPVKKNNIDSINIYINCNNNFKAPFFSNSEIGCLIVSINNKTVLTLSIKSSNTIYKKSYSDFFVTLLKDYTYYLESLLFINNSL